MAISVNPSRNPSASSTNPAAGVQSSSNSSSSRIRLPSSTATLPSSPTISGAKADSSRALSGRQSNGSTNKRVFSQKPEHRLNENGTNRIASKSIDKQSIHRRTSELSKTNNAPLASITNRSASSSYDDEMQSSRKMPSASAAAIAATLRASDEASNDAGDGSSDRIHAPRSSQGTSRSVSHRVPSALRRLPPGGSRIASRTILPSGAYPGTDPAMPSSSSSHQSGTSMRSAPTALARANGRRSLGATLNAAATGGAAQHDRDGRELNKLTVDSTSFEEWMKMATDNKINATNTWNFALIDYFHDMSLLKSDNGDGSINFQKASCTLDGCVKVWTSRVDSVVVETGKLLSGLQDDGKDSNAKGGRGRNADEEEGEGDEDVDGSGQKKKKARAKEPTLVKSFNQLAVKKLDLEFTVDPLFKKTSADFDEGGAGGLLMNHLGVDSKARVVFDASDVPGQDDVEEDETPVIVEDEDLQSEIDQEDEGDMTETEHTSRNDRNGDFIDLTKIRSKLFGQNDFAFEQEDALGTLLTEMTVCPTFASFRFAPDDNTPFSALMAENENGSSNAPTFGFDTMTQSNTWEDEPMNDGGVFDDGMDDAFGDIGGGGAAMNGLYAGSAEPFDYQEANFDDGEEGGNFFTGEGSAQPQGPPDFSSLQGILNNSSDQPFEGDDFFGYFDQKMSKNWAGPEHWKMRNVMTSMAGGANAANGGASEKSTRKQKEPFVIDFTSSEGAVTSKELFETGRGQAGTLLPASKDFDDLYLLPEDRHFSSKQLLRLFIKPRAMLNPRRQGQMLDERAAMRTDVEADYWIQAAAQNSGLEGQGGAGFGFDDGDNVGMPEVPFDTQFFHEDDDGGFDPMGEATENALALEPEDEEELATQALKRIRPEFVNYAKKAKRVDVRKLKNNIWRELAIFAAEEDDEEEDVDTSGEQSGSGIGNESGRHTTPKPGDSMDLDKSSLVKRDPTDPRTFDAVLSGLRKLYPKDRMEEISTSFCFICLLHLANEEGLQIQAGSNDLSMLAGKMIVEDDEDEMDVPERIRNVKRASHTPFDDILVDEEDPDQYRVGFLGQLSIAKDPTAGRSA